MLKQQDMTETARVVFNELSVTEPATVGEIAQNTYLSRERCQLILTQLVMAGLADYQFGCYRRLQPEGFFICGKWAAGGC
ncbi:TrmB family transcriptional regulator [Escherichia coli]|nr:TrmB family transcriptional regulator [Escherichia coli]